MFTLPYTFRFLFTFLFLINLANVYASAKVKKYADDSEEMGDETKDQELEISQEVEIKNVTKECSRRSSNQVHEIRKASHNQFPFVVALLSSSHDYVCAGSIVSNGMILTSSKCAETANYVLTNSTSAKKNESSIILNVIKSETYPTHRDIAIVYTEKFNDTSLSKIGISNDTKPSGISFVEAIGFGLNTEVGQTKELQSVGIETEQIADKMSGFLNCIDTKVLSCFKDKGGPLIIDEELVGVIVKGDDECLGEITSKYAINKHMVDYIGSYVFKAWLADKIQRNEEKGAVTLDSYSKKSVLREAPHKMTAGVAPKKISFFGVMFVILLVTFL